MLLLGYLFLYAVLLIAALALVLIIILYVITQPYPVIHRYDDEKYFFNPKRKCKEPFPSLHDPWSVNLSVIVPAYNEESRLPLMLDECLEYLEKLASSGCTYEIIVVSDGSTDNTVDVALTYAFKYETIRVLALVKNRGKGGAVRLGIMSARGSAILFADADGATKFEDLQKLDDSLQEVLQCDYINNPDKVSTQHAVICGSRAHLEEEETAKRSIFRLILMHGFHFLVWLWCVKGIRDTQCGFKLLTRRSARAIFQSLHVERWAFDVEMLYIAQTLNIPITEIAVHWTEIEGSKIVPFWSWMQMGIDLFLIWLRYTIGAWRINRPKET